ncbi:Hypothetical predicted protein, partial [Cloeon dipterum]
MEMLQGIRKFRSRCGFNCSTSSATNRTESKRLMNDLIYACIAASGAKSPLLSLSPEPAVLLFELTVRNATLAATFQIHPKSFSSNHKCCPDCLLRNFEREQIEIPFLFVIQNSLQ